MLAFFHSVAAGRGRPGLLPSSVQRLAADCGIGAVNLARRRALYSSEAAFLAPESERTGGHG